MDLNNPPVLSEEQKARLEALAKRPDSEIDFSDIPELDDSFWKNAVQNPFYKPTKQVTTVRIDSDVMQWLKNTEKTCENSQVHYTYCMLGEYDERLTKLKKQLKN